MNDQDWLDYQPVPIGHPGGECDNPLCEMAQGRAQLEASLPREITQQWNPKETA